MGIFPLVSNWFVLWLCFSFAYMSVVVSCVEGLEVQGMRFCRFIFDFWMHGHSIFFLRSRYSHVDCFSML